MEDKEDLSLDPRAKPDVWDNVTNLERVVWALSRLEFYGFVTHQESRLIQKRIKAWKRGALDSRGKPLGNRPI